MLGFLAGGFLTEYDFARQAFLVMALLGIVISITACRLDKKLEEGVKETTSMSCWSRTKFNFSMIKESFKTRELARSLMFFTILGVVIPRYDDYMYFYLTSDKYADFSKFTYAIIRMTSFFGSGIGIACFNSFCKEVSIKIMMVMACIINVLSALGQIMFLKGVYLGMKPVIFYALVEMVSDAFSFAFLTMPIMCLVAKMIPHSVESAIFAFFTGLNILNYFFISKILGNLYNLYFKVTKETL